MKKSIIQLTDIVKDYRKMRALDGVSMDIPPGITGLLGPNGAGKSTLIKVILDLVRVNSGSGNVLGMKLGKQGRAIRDHVGYMPEDDCYIPGMSGVEVVQFSACLAGLPTIEALRRSHEILDFCGMKQERYRTIETFSTGMRQKIKFAAAIVHDPDLLILDEPTSGLDPEEREALLKRIRILCDQAGKSVVISTHILPDVQAICDHVLILSNGKVVLSESLAVLNRPTEDSVTIRVDGDPNEVSQILASKGLSSTVTPDNQLVVHSSNENVLQQIWGTIAKSGNMIQSLVPATNSLEEIFVRTVQEATHADS